MTTTEPVRRHDALDEAYDLPCRPPTRRTLDSSTTAPMACEALHTLGHDEELTGAGAPVRDATSPGDHRSPRLNMKT